MLYVLCSAMHAHTDQQRVLHTCMRVSRYIRMLRTPGDGNDCGITSDPVMAVVHPKYATRKEAGYVPLAEQLAQAAPTA